MTIHHAVAEIRPSMAGAELAEKLDVPATTVLLRLDQADYTADGRAIMYSEEELVAGVLSVQVYRKGPGG